MLCIERCMVSVFWTDISVPTFSLFLLIMSSYNKTTWYLAEALVKRDYESRGYECLHENYTIRGGELDLILEDSQSLFFVEVKAVHHIDSLYDYITPGKKKALVRTIETYLYKHPTEKEVVCEVVFVKWNAILEIFPLF